MKNQKPLVTQGLLEGRYDAGITHMDLLTNNPGKFRLKKYFGYVQTTWIVYGKTTSNNKNILGVKPIGFYNTNTI